MPRIGIDLEDIKVITPKKKKAASHPKGKAGEYAIIKILDKYSGSKWIRIPNSGAQLGQSNAQRVHQLHESQIEALLGDIFPPGDLKYRFIIESKNYATFPFDKLQKAANGSGEVPAKLLEWMEQVQHDCVTYLSTPATRQHIGLLFVKITKMGEWIVFNRKYMKNLIDAVVPPGSKLFAASVYGSYVDSEGFVKNSLPGYGDEWIWCSAEEFIKLNADKLFVKR